MTQDRNPVLAAACLLGALLLTFLASCDSTPEKPIDTEDWVAVGDLIQVSATHRSDAIAADVYVDIDGTVCLPEIGLVNVAGRTAPEIRELLLEKYGPYHDDLDIHVEITTAFTRSSPKSESANLGRVKVIRADPRDPKILIIVPAAQEPAPEAAPVPEIVPDELGPNSWWACGGRAR